MPLFYFDVFDGDRVLLDNVGSDLEDERAAREEAIATLTSMAHDRLPNNGEMRDLAVHVRNDEGANLLRVSLRFELRADYGFSGSRS